MAGNDCAQSIHGVTIRVARLAADGSTPEGANNLYVTEAFALLTAEPAVMAGQLISVPNAVGYGSVNVQDSDQLTHLNLTLELLAPDPELLELLTGATLVTDGSGNTVGFSYPKLNTPYNRYGCSFEIWSEATDGGECVDALPYFRWVMTRTKNWRFNVRNWDNTLMTNAVTGIAVENTAFGSGPMNDWAGPVDRVLTSLRVPSYPAGQCGYQATPPQV